MVRPSGVSQGSGVVVICFLNQPVCLQSAEIQVRQTGGEPDLLRLIVTDLPSTSAEAQYSAREFSLRLENIDQPVHYNVSDNGFGTIPEVGLRGYLLFANIEPVLVVTGNENVTPPG